MEQYQKQRTFLYFVKTAFFTDDTVMTCAVAEAIMNGGQKDDFIDAMKKYGRLYPNADYGARFNAWLNSITVILIIALGMDQLCVFLHVLGSWTVVFMRELVCGHHLEDLRVFLQR